MMAATFDVAQRLAEGEQALAVLDDYVAACRALGLPSAASLPDLYRAESGLDLAALTADARSLDAAALAAQDALRLQGNGYRELTDQWSGTGGDAAAGFLRTLTSAAEDVVAHLQRGAQALTTLRDELWRAVDAKVDAVVRAGAQAAGHRDAWHAAARAVLGGAGHVAAASEIIDQQVKPFVLRAVDGDLLPALLAASEAVAAAYDSALAAAIPPGVTFVVPFVMTPPPAAAPAYQAAAAAPLGASGTTASWAPWAPVMPPDGGVPGGVGLGSGVSGLGQQLADVIGGVLGSMAGFGTDAAGLGSALDSGWDDDLGLDDADDAEPEEKDVDDEDSDSVTDADDEEALDEVIPEAPEPAVDQPTEPAGQPVPAPTPPPEPVPPAEPVGQQSNPTTRTPCEIAADELPLAGE
mgnify:FL=1